MPTRITSVNRVPLTIRIRIQASPPEWAQAVRAIEPHQYRVESTIALTQQIMSGHRVRALTVETGKGAALRAMTIGTVSQRLALLPAHSLQHTALHVGAQQVRPDTGAFSFIFRQQTVFTVKHTTARCTLYLDRQTILLIEPRHRLLCLGVDNRNTVQRVIAISAQHASGFRRIVHGSVRPASKV